MHLIQTSQNRGVKWIVKMHHGLIGTIDHKVILNQIVRAKTKEVDMRCHEIAGLCRSRGLNHHTDRNPGIKSDALAIKFLLYIRNNVASSAEIIHGGHERKQYARCSESRRPIERTELSAKDVLILKTESEAANPK